MGPKVRMLAGVVLAIESVRIAGTPEAAMAIVEGDTEHELARFSVVKAVGMVAMLKSVGDCPHGNDEDIACDILKGMGINPETGHYLKGHSKPGEYH